MAKPRKAHLGPTQKDIADALGISQSTVAVALGDDNEGKLMVETVARIREYAAKVGYRPQRFAQIMRGGETKIIGVIAQLGVYSSNHELVRKLANALSRTGYRLVLVDLMWFDGNLEAVKNYLLDQAVEGVVFCNVFPRSQAVAMRELLPRTLPVVSLSSSLDDVPNIRVDTHSAFQEMTRLHLAMGSRQLSIVSKFRDAGVLARPDWSIRDRITGFAQAIHEAGGIVIADEIVQELMEISGCKTRRPVSYNGIVGRIIYPEKTIHLSDAFENGFHQTLKLIDLEALPDSLICMNDDTALGALAACSDRGLGVPDDVRISGYDDTPAGRFGAVPLTTVRKPLDELAQRAVQTLLRCIQSPEKGRESTNEFLPGEIVIRRSLGTCDEVRQLTADGFFQASSGSACFEFSPENERLEKFGSAPQPTLNSAPQIQQPA